MINSDINIDVSSVFVRNYQSKADVICHQGGTRSGKTYSILQTIILKHCLNERGNIIDIVRKTQSEIKDTLIPDFEEILQNVHIDEKRTAWDITQHRSTRLEYKINGNTIRFIGLDKSQKKRGAKRDILYINEANGITNEDWIQLSIRTSGKIYIDYNPSELFWINDLIFDGLSYIEIDSRTYNADFHNPKKKDTRTGRYKRKLTYEFIKSTYLDNIDFLSARQILNIEALIGMDQYYEDVYVHGKLASLRGKIYNNINIIEPHEWMEETKLAETFYGLDIGYDHPTVFIEIKYHKEKTWTRARYWERFKHDDDFLKWLEKSHVSMIDDIYVDSAFPAWISKLKNKGFNARKSNKTVKDGISFCQSIQHNICNDEGSQDYIRQMQKYKNKQLSTGEIIDEPVKFEDDGPDAYRYGVYTHLRKRIHRVGMS